MFIFIYHKWSLNYKKEQQLSTFQIILFFLGKEDGKKNDDFEIRKKEDSVQKKRQYRSNKDDSSSDSDHGKSRKVWISTAVSLKQSIGAVWIIYEP